MTRKPNANLPELSRLEQEVMNIVWQLKECSSAEVIEAYARERQLAKTTIRTVLTNLRKKGYLEKVPTVERGFRLRPVVSRETVARRTLKNMVGTLFGGSPRYVVSCLLKESKLDEAELEEIRRMLKIQS
jgi:BlaI family transcriptional regulator, penicillinase repressor